MISFELSITNLIIVAAVAFLATFYVIILLKLKPSTEKKDQHKKDVLLEKQKSPPKKEPILVNPLKAKEKITPPQRTQNQISPKKIRPPFTKSTSPSTPQNKTKETPEHVIVSETGSSNLHCVHHFGYLTELPKNTAIPTECLGCPRAVECMTMLKVEEKQVKSHVTKS